MNDTPSSRVDFRTPFRQSPLESEFCVAFRVNASDTEYRSPVYGSSSGVISECPWFAERGQQSSGYRGSGTSTTLNADWPTGIALLTFTEYLSPARNVPVTAVQARPMTQEVPPQRHPTRICRDTFQNVVGIKQARRNECRRLPTTEQRGQNGRDFPECEGQRGQSRRNGRGEWYRRFPTIRPGRRLMMSTGTRRVTVIVRASSIPGHFSISEPRNTEGQSGRMVTGHRDNIEYRSVEPGISSLQSSRHEYHQAGSHSHAVTEYRLPTRHAEYNNNGQHIISHRQHQQWIRVGDHLGESSEGEESNNNTGMGRRMNVNECIFVINQIVIVIVINTNTGQYGLSEWFRGV